MKTQEPISFFDRLIDEAIGQDMDVQPNHFFVQNVMSNIYSISGNAASGDFLTPQFRLRMAVVYGFSVAAAIISGYLIGDFGSSNATLNMVQVNFENMNMTNLLSF